MFLNKPEKRKGTGTVRETRAPAAFSKVKIAEEGVDGLFDGGWDAQI